MIKLNENHWALKLAAECNYSGIGGLQYGNIVVTVTQADSVDGFGLFTITAYHQELHIGKAYTVIQNAFNITLVECDIDEYGGCYYVGAQTTEDQAVKEMFL